MVRDLRTRVAQAATVASSPQPAQAGELLTAAEVADCLKLSRRTVWRWCKSGHLPARKVGHQWRIARGDLEAFIELHGKL